MNLLDTLKQLRDDLKTWVTNNLNALNTKIDEKTIPIDSELSATSTNPVQNKTITNAINNIPRFSGSYNDLTDAPNIAEDDSGNMVITDESGNIIFKADADGIHTTAVSIDGEAAATEKYVDDAVANIDIPEVDFTGYATEDFVTNSVESAKTEISESIVSESDEWKVVDETGNIILSVDATGAHTTNLTLNGESVEDIVTDKIASLVDSAPEALNTLNELANALGDDPNFATTVATEIGNKVDKVDGKGLSTNDFTNDYKNTLDNLGSMAFNEVDPTVPAWAKEATKPTYTANEVGALADTTVLADLTDDATHRTVTDVEKATWNAKSDFSGSYDDLTNAPNITDNDNGDLIVADEQGNIVLKTDANGIEVTKLTTDELVVNGKNINEIVSDTSSIGKEGEGEFSEIFNDYENNSALGDYSHTEGEKTSGFSRNAHAEGGQAKAGGKGFKITDCSGPNPDGSGYYTIGGTEIDDIELGVDRYSVRLSTAAYDVGVILSAQKFGNGVTELLVSNYPNIPIEVEDVIDPENYTVENYLTIVGKPQIGNIDIGFNAHSEGEGAIAQDRATHAEGRNTKAIGQYGHSEGRDTVAAYAAHAEGRGTKAIGNMAHAEGQNSKALGERAHAEGATTEAIGNNSHAEGQNTKAIGHTSHAEGWGSRAEADVTHAEGIETKAYGYGSHSEGNKTEALGVSSHAEGQETKANGNNAHAEGYGAVAIEAAAHAEGVGTQAKGIGSHAEGHQTIAEGMNSHTEGQQSQAIGDLSHAEGYATKATKTAAHAEGSGAQAIGSATHAEGQDTVAEGYSAHAEGIGSKAQGTGSHAAGLNTIAKGDYQTTIGKFNVEDPTAAFIIGNGNNNSERDNALMVDWDGNMTLAGRVIPSDYTNLDERYVRDTGDLGPILNYCGEVSNTSELPETADDGDVYSVSQLTVNNGLIYTGKINELFGCDTEANVFVNLTGNPDNLIVYHTKINLPENYYYDDIEGKYHGEPEKWCCFYSKTGNRIGTTAMGGPNGYPMCYDLESAFGTSDPNEVVTIVFGAREDTTQTEWPYGFPDKLDVKSIKTTYCWMNGGWTPIGGNVSNENESEIGKNGEGRFSEIFNDYENNVASGDYSHTEGEKNVSFSRNSHAEGGQTKAGGKGFKITSCVGPNMDGSGYYTIAGVDISGIELGVDRYNVRLDSVAYDVGVILEAQKLQSGAIELLVSNYPNIPIKEANATDPENYAIDNYLTIVGKPEIGNINIGFNSHAEGEFTIAQDKGTHAEGRNTMAIGQYGHAEGRDTVAAYAAHAEGRESVALGDVSHAEGCETSATGKFSHSEGFQTFAVGRFAHAEGDNTHADGYNSHAEGSNTYGTGNFSHAEGQETKAYGAATHTEGYNTTTSETATAAHAEGSNTQANGVTSHAEGQGTKALGESSHSEGSGTTAHNQYSHAEGKSTHAEGKASHAEGTQSKSTGNNSHAEGEQSVASGMDSHAEGYLTKALGMMSHAEGAKAVAKGNYSHAEGISQNPPADSVYDLSKNELVEQWKTNNKGFGVAKGEYSHTEGENTIAVGNGSHAEGRKTLAYGNVSHAEGYYTIANGDYQHVGGKWNAPDNSSLFIIGNGTSEDDRRNALTLDSSENLNVTGKIVPGDYSNFDARYPKNISSEDIIEMKNRIQALEETIAALI